MAWIPKPGSFHYNKTNADYKNLLGLYETYPGKPAPIDVLKEAAIADGYPPEKVAKFKYKAASYYDAILKCLKRTKTSINYNIIKKVEIDEIDEDNVDIEENKMDVDEFHTDDDEPDYEDHDD